jgi:Polysaccharide lyase
MLGRLTSALTILVFLCSSAAAQAVDEVRTGFEDSVIPPQFVKCDRPENTIAISSKEARRGSKSLSLVINETPLFPETATVTSFRWSPSPASCLSADKADLYRSDDVERAELWENKEFAPRFGEEAWYGFSMWIDSSSVPYGDLHRVVLGQWKANHASDPKVDYSPFLAQRLTGGFYHITLDVDAKARTNDDGEPKTCRILLAFMSGPPSSADPELDLKRPLQCETRHQHSNLDLIPADPIQIDREAYLPRPFNRWTDLIFRVRGGKDGIVQVWANGVLIATARGWIGHKAAVGSKQYFKFGPYRDPAPNPFVVYLDNLARGDSKDYVDPSQH